MNSKFTNYQTIEITLIANSTLDTSCLQSALIQAGYKVQPWTTGKQGLEQIASHPPDLIVMEADLPDMTGYKLCQLLKTMNQLRYVPIIFLDTTDEPLHQLQAFRSGATDYLVSPIDPLKLLVRIEAQLRL